MATIIFNNFNGKNPFNQQPIEEIPIHKQDLVIHIGTCLKQIPPKQLCRCLREVFMLRWEEMVVTCPNFKNVVTDLVILMARLDAVEDGREFE